MCELFGYSSSSIRDINRELKEFFSHSEEHPHGWGLAVSDVERILVEKQSCKANDSFYLKDRLSEPIETTFALAHIRFATIGVPERKNSHPYVRKDKTGKEWILIHNGTLFEETVTKKYYEVQKGDTDSERILLYLVDKINESSSENYFEVLENVMSELAPHNKLNLIIYDGEYLYVHTNYKDSLHYLSRTDEVIISTRPLTDFSWEPLPLNVLHVFKDGRLVYKGNDHGFEHIPDPEKLKELYWAFSHL